MDKMNWTQDFIEHGWTGENGYLILLVDFHAGKSFYKVYQNSVAVRGGEFDKLEDAKEFVEKL